eukprot:CAMPEP_0175143070 /NCGR_PEP_ID=MMETSP0087-20121206/13204_1 /TAXON_ID=136419 /ORGANISM="Unknown Unknown, Strain D1" /LENGTH=606 /DNA_ID=CAMNT_0016427051 /DNA_START=53 /DNA_END=1873 /DNA_ORIENTATION=-
MESALEERNTITRATRSKLKSIRQLAVVTFLIHVVMTVIMLEFAFFPKIIGNTKKIGKTCEPTYNGNITNWKLSNPTSYPNMRYADCLAKCCEKNTAVTDCTDFAVDNSRNTSICYHFDRTVFSISNEIEQNSSLQRCTAVGAPNCDPNPLQVHSMVDFELSASLVLCSFGGMVGCIWAFVGVYEFFKGSREHLTLPDLTWHDRNFLLSSFVFVVFTFCVWPSLMIFIFQTVGDDFLTIIRQLSEANTAVITPTSLAAAAATQTLQNARVHVVASPVVAGMDRWMVVSKVLPAAAVSLVVRTGTCAAPGDKVLFSIPDVGHLNLNHSMLQGLYYDRQGLYYDRPALDTIDGKVVEVLIGNEVGCGIFDGNINSFYLFHTTLFFLGALFDLAMAYTGTRFLWQHREMLEKITSEEEEDLSVRMPKRAVFLSVSKMLILLCNCVDLILQLTRQWNSPVFLCLLIDVAMVVWFAFICRAGGRSWAAGDIEDWLMKFRLFGVVSFIVQFIIFFVVVTVILMIERYQLAFWDGVYSAGMIDPGHQAAVTMQFLLWLVGVLVYGRILFLQSRCMLDLDELCNCDIVLKEFYSHDKDEAKTAEDPNSRNTMAI